ncbi:hypothetical protein CEXT_626941 [Caerostris extrusa]|uniref:Uncharacterized protein n=1 Tax=Caerostris extrusa TaxID=172846 RepID=A0AAV4M6M1_CAEEX|nr:hypothetical protein CEXT_626941 [Caerostris extrusa]
MQMHSSRARTRSAWPSVEIKSGNMHLNTSFPAGIHSWWKARSSPGVSGKGGEIDVSSSRPRGGLSAHFIRFLTVQFEGVEERALSEKYFWKHE